MSITSDLIDRIEASLPELKFIVLSQEQRRQLADEAPGNMSHTYEKDLERFVEMKEKGYVAMFCGIPVLDRNSVIVME